MFLILPRELGSKMQLRQFFADGKEIILFKLFYISVTFHTRIQNFWFSGQFHFPLCVIRYCNERNQCEHP